MPSDAAWLPALLLIACGGGRAATPAPAGGGDPEAGEDRSTPCGAMIAHLDAEAFTAGGSVTIGEETMTRDSLALRCAQYSPWMIACVSLSLTTAELSTCAPGNEPTSGTYAGPSAEEKAAFEACVAAATSRGQLDACGY